VLSSRSNASEYQEELRRQIEEKRRIKQVQRNKEIEWERKKRAEMESYNPFGRPGHGAPCRNARGEVLSTLGRMHSARRQKRDNGKRRPATFLSSIRNMYDPSYEQNIKQKRKRQAEWVAELDKQRRAKQAAKEAREREREKQRARDEQEFDRVRQQLAKLPLEALTASQKRPVGMFVVEKNPTDDKVRARPPALDTSGVFHDFPHPKKQSMQYHKNEIYPTADKSPKIRPLDSNYFDDILNDDLHIAFESPRLQNLPKNKEDALAILDRFLKDL